MEGPNSQGWRDLGPGSSYKVAQERPGAAGAYKAAASLSVWSQSLAPFVPTGLSQFLEDPSFSLGVHLHEP